MLPRAFQVRRLLLGLVASFLTVRYLYNLSSNDTGSSGKNVEADSRRVIQDLQDLTALGTPSQQLNVSVLPQEGRHAEILARFISIYTGDPSLSLWQTLTSFLRVYYPWIQTPSSLAYRPFAAPVTQLTGSSSGSSLANTTGIVIIVSSRDFLFAAQLISTLRNVLQSNLPIEITYLSRGTYELSPGKRDALSSLVKDVYLNDLLSHFSNELAQLGSSGTTFSHALKPFAVLASRFSSVLVMDPDVVFLRSPDNLLGSHSEFQRSGTLLFHPRAWRDPSGGKSNDQRDWIDEYLLAARVPSPELQRSLYWTQELGGLIDDGVVGVNKSVPSVWASLLVAAKLHMPSVREELYEHLGADGTAEIWWIAAEMAGAPYGLQSGYAGCIGQLEGTLHQRQMCSAHSLQMDERGLKPLWFSGGLVKNKAIGGAASVEGTKPEMFEHYMVPGVRAEEWDEQPRWLHTNDEVWCAEGRPVIPLKVNGLDGVLKDLIEEAKSVEQRYRDA